MKRLLLHIRMVLRLIAVVRNWPIYFWNRFGLIKGLVTYHLRNGQTISSRSFETDGGALNDVWFDESYEPSRFGLTFDWSRCKAIIDVGANIGTFTVFAAHKSPQATIISVEPEPGNLVLLEKNVQDNGLTSRVRIVPAAIGGADGEMTLHVSSKSSGGHSLYHRYGETRDVAVKVLSLPTLFREHSIDTCDFLKLDCEGGEYDALYALSAEELRRIHFMAVEYHHFSKDPRHTFDSLSTFLRENGFIVTLGKKSMFFAYRRESASVAT